MSHESHNLEVTDTLDENLQFWHEEEDSSFLDLNFKHDKWDTYLGEMSKLLTTTAFQSACAASEEPIGTHQFRALSDLIAYVCS